MGFNLFKTPGNSDDLLTQADAALARFEKDHAGFVAEKDEKMKRQVELWSVLTPSEALKNEYKMVSSHIAFLIKKMMCLDEHIKQLKLARYHAQNGDTARLKQILEIQDPCKAIEPSITELALMG